jgi:hypothetical protein
LIPFKVIPTKKGVIPTGDVDGIFFGCGAHSCFPCVKLNLDSFNNASFISAVERGSLEKLLQAAHAATHRLFKPREANLTKALDIIEGVFAAIFVHPDSAEQLVRCIPERSAAVCDCVFVTVDNASESAAQSCTM